MVTNNYDFKTVTRLRMLCMKVLPTVYGDALSYEEQICKVTEKINQLVDTVNALPDYIVEVVKELIDAAGLEDIVRNVLADLYFINVKNPPAPFVAAKGDGATNDTAAIQALLNYAGLQRSYLFFPAGNYIVSGLTMVKNVSLVGLDRYSSIITLAPDSNRDLITGFVENASISNLTLNANMNGQTSNCSCLNATVDNALIDFVIFRNGYDSVVVENTNEFEGAYWMFDGIQHNALTLNGEGAVISNVIFKNASQLSSNTLIVINGNNKITGIFSNTAIPNGVIISTTGAIVEGTILNATNTITGGSGNFINLLDNNSNIRYSSSINENIANNLHTSAANKTENITNDINTTSTNKTENITNNINITAANKTENINNTKTINANTLFLNPVKPLKYSHPEAYNQFFDSVKMTDTSNNLYDVLTPGKNINEIGKQGEYTFYHNYIYYYVDGINGNDDNDGLSKNTPVKTIEKIFDLTNKGANDLRINILSAGIYTLTKNVFSGLNTHIAGSVDGVILYFSFNQPIPIYLSNCNWSNITIRNYNGQRIYFDNCVTTFNNVIFESGVTGFYGGYCDHLNCTFGRVQYFCCNGQCNGITITLGTNNAPAINIDRGANMMIYNSLNLPTIDGAPTDNNCIYMVRASKVIIGSAPNAPTGYYYGIKADSSIVMITSGRYTSYQTNTLNGNYI